jgi:hypothetical protein
MIAYSGFFIPEYSAFDFFLGIDATGADVRFCLGHHFHKFRISVNFFQRGLVTLDSFADVGSSFRLCFSLAYAARQSLGTPPPK